MRENAEQKKTRKANPAPGRRPLPLPSVPTQSACRPPPFLPLTSIIFMQNLVNLRLQRIIGASSRLSAASLVVFLICIVLLMLWFRLLDTITCILRVPLIPSNRNSWARPRSFAFPATESSNGGTNPGGGGDGSAQHGGTFRADGLTTLRPSLSPLLLKNLSVFPQQDAYCMQLRAALPKADGNGQEALYFYQIDPSSIHSAICDPRGEIRNTIVSGNP